MGYFPIHCHIVSYVLSSINVVETTLVYVLDPTMNAPVKMQHALSSEDIKTNPSTGKV